MSASDRNSKFLSLVLRHQPEAIGLALDPQGWADIDELLARAAEHGTVLTRAALLEIVALNDKKRFALDASATRIRANQGHSISVDLALVPKAPPPLLFHGTATRFVDAIRAKGLVAGARQHVHLSASEKTATQVGSRYGKPALLLVHAAAMQRDGVVFYESANGVWLTHEVPVAYIDFP